MPTHLEALKARIRDIENLYSVANVLEWDMQAYMPPGGAEARAEQIGLITRLHHETLTSSVTGELIEKAEGENSGGDPDGENARLIAVARREYDREVKIPIALAEERSRHSALSESLWRVAREKNDFAGFAPYLEESVDLSKQVAECIGYESDPYDALLSFHEVGSKTADVAAVFASIKPRLIEQTRQIVDSGRQFETLDGHFPIAVQPELT